LFAADADYGKAAWIADRILVGVRALSRKVASEELSVTVSIGVAFHEPGQTLEQVVNAAHERLHQAKHQGRNRIVYAASA
jgi:diguanylate cyclase (GGDEF)-like protein